MNNLISVIIPTINHKFIYDSLVSILNQEDVNIEVIIIDDSNDNKILDLITRIGDNRVKYFKGEKLGIASALNLAINLSSGEYIARMDDDDISTKDRLIRQLDYLNRNKLDICGSNIQIIGNNRIIKYPEFHNQINFSLNFYCALAHPTIFSKASFYKINKYSINDYYEEDYNLWIKTKDHYKFGNIQETLLKYRIHNDQSSKNICSSILINNNLNKNFHNIKSINKKLDELKIYDSSIKNVIYYYYLINNKVPFFQMLRNCGIMVSLKFIYKLWKKKFFSLLF